MEQFEGQAAEQTAETVDSGAPAPSQAGSLGHRWIGGYLLERELGAGAMGVVYAGFDPKLERRVAVKVLKRQTDPKAQQRFLREAQAMARLAHPNVVQVYDIDAVEGTTFIIMELVRGVTLSRWLSEQTRTRSEILEAFRGAGAGLAAAHARGLVHRDFKPANVMVDESGRTLVMDFGLAKEWQRDISTTGGLRAGALLDRMTTKGKVMGTLEYMAPEQLDGLEATASADQFSFCVALWEALHGQRPFVAAKVLDLLVAIKQGSYVLPERSCDVPEWIREVLLRGMQIEPTQRWSSMVVLLEALATEPDPEASRPERGLPGWVWFGLGLAVAAVVAALAWALGRV